jgi:hypothetical protein
MFENGAPLRFYDIHFVSEFLTVFCLDPKTQI